MIRNGLFLISIALLLFIFSVNRATHQYDILSMTTSLVLFLVGVGLCMKEKKKEETSLSSKERKHGSKD
jgi:predicted tellurium resistance membrane protein TerC